MVVALLVVALVDRMLGMAVVMEVTVATKAVPGAAVVVAQEVILEMAVLAVAVRLHRCGYLTTGKQALAVPEVVVEWVGFPTMPVPEVASVF
jgi:hypothetical protein